MTQKLLLLFLLAGLFSGCRKYNDPNNRVDIYLLRSFDAGVDQSTIPPTTVLSNAELESEPLVRNKEIRYYKKSSTTFHLKENVYDRIKDLGPDKAFAVTVNGNPVYYGRFHPLYMSSIVYGVATIEPPVEGDGRSIKIRFALFDNDPAIKALDKRNDPALLSALKATGRLR